MQLTMLQAEGHATVWMTASPTEKHTGMIYAPAVSGVMCVSSRGRRGPSASPGNLFGHGREKPLAPSPLGRGRGVRVREQVRKPLGTLTLTLSRREGRPLSWAPSADAVAGGGNMGAWPTRLFETALGIYARAQGRRYAGAY